MNVQRDCRDSWHDVTSKVNRAVVFLDDASAECLHWNGGAMLLMEAGAVDIKHFSSFEVCGASQRKAVFVVSSVLMGTTTEILREIITASRLQYVIVMTTVSPAHQSLLRYGVGAPDDRILHDMEDNLLQWMGNMNYSAEVTYIPLVTAPITRNLFTLPPHSSVFPLLPTDIDVIKADSPSGSLEIGYLPEELQVQIKGIATGLHGCMSQLGVSEDVYALGETSKLIATELANMPVAKARRKNVSARCSLVLVDRTVDTAEAASVHWDTLLDRVLAALPRLPGHNNDVMVNMAPVCAVTENPECRVVVPGCLAHPSSSATTALLHSLATHKHKEGVLEVNRQLVSAASQESLPLSVKPGRVTADTLNSHIALFRSKPASVRKHAALLQVCQAVASSLPLSRDEALGLEKAVLQAMGEEEGSLAYITQALRRAMEMQAGERSHSLEDMFVVLVFIYSLAGSTADLGSSQDEKALQALLVKAILSTPVSDLPQFLTELVGEDVAETRVKLVLQDIFEKLRGLCACRQGLRHLNKVFSPGTAVSPSTRHALIPQLMEAIFHPDKPDLPDLVCRTTGLTDKLKKGFGLFMSVSKPRPSDHPNVIVFVVGGVTSTEARKITEAAGHGATQVIVGGTSLLKPTDLLQKILVQDNLHPPMQI